MNITDVDDKIIRNSAEAGVPIGEYTQRYVDAFFEDMEALRIERPETIARATEHIPQMVALVERLAARERRTRPKMARGISGWRRFRSTAS